HPFFRGSRSGLPLLQLSRARFYCDSKTFARTRFRLPKTLLAFGTSKQKSQIYLSEPEVGVNSSTPRPDATACTLWRCRFSHCTGDYVSGYSEEIAMLRNQPGKSAETQSTSSQIRSVPDSSTRHKH